jgi:adenosyl cobinamide kinase/adenosyl cobinamide phosphate guanylyltransferase
VSGLTFLVGGARSGKSRLAGRLAAESGRPVVVIATGEAGDEEMTERIRRHRAERPAAWTTVEEPLALGEALVTADAGAFVIVDCLTLWVSNLLGAGRIDGDVEHEAVEAARLASARPGGAVVVSNEVGLGVIAANPLARRYVDLLGRVNTIWADAADRSFLLVAGRPIPLVDGLADG